jgi:regulator of sigma E protease
MLTLFAFLLTLAVLIVVHEYGHYLAARWCGVKVLCFSIGFGKPLLSRRIGADETEFVLAAFPPGGFVRMLDEREAPVAQHELSRAFNRQPVSKRMAIVAAGPLFNLVLAVLLYWVLFMSGIAGLRPILGDIPAGSSAERASLKSGELISKVDGVAVATWQDVRWALLKEMLRSKSVEVETVSGRNEIHLQRLDLSGLVGDDVEGDVLEKLGLTAYRPAMPARVGEILPDSVAEKAGLTVGDEISTVNGVAVARWEDFVNMVQQNPDKRITLHLVRSGRPLEVVVTPETINENGKRIGRIGAAYRLNQAEIDKLTVDVKYPPLKAFSHAVAKTWESSVFSLRMLGSMISGAISWKGISGPVTIASYAGQSAHVGWKAFIAFLAVISISLGVLNLLPVPVLDGGHLMYYVVEVLKGSPVSDSAMEIGQKIGFTLLGLLMACALYNDLNRIITG